MKILLLILIGLFAGILSGTVGIGGGIVLVPALVLLLGYTQKLAQGTTLAVLMMPVVILGVLQYYRHGNVRFDAAVYIAIGFLFGGYLGGFLVNSIPEVLHLTDSLTIHKPVSKLFALLMLVVAIRMLFFS